MKSQAEPKNKNTAPSMEQWAKLYEVAGVIKDLAPWNTLWDNDLITIMLPEREEPVYCSVMGRHGECFGISVYPGYKSITGYYRLLDTNKKVPSFIGFSYQNCLTCYYGDREEIAPQEKNIIDKLGLKFRGRNNWIYFRAMRTGYYPWFLDAEQVDLMTQALQNLVMAYRHYASGKIKVDFENDETLLRIYSPEKGEWLNGAVKMPDIIMNIPKYIIKDEIFIESLGSQKKNAMQLEFDQIYIPTPIQESKDEAPMLPRIVLLADRKSGMMLGQSPIMNNGNSEDIIIGMLQEYIMNHGRPSAIYIRDEIFGSYIEDLCGKIGVKIFCGKGMPCINAIAEDLADFMRQGV